MDTIKSINLQKQSTVFSDYFYLKICVTLFIFKTLYNKHSDACIYLPPYKLDVLKITYFNKVL